MTARVAATSATTSSKGQTGDDPESQYQRALKLLQDPILPVRAHGLLLLRELVDPQTAKGSQARTPAITSAYMPAILDIFMQTIQDDDSYMYLNAVRGLSALVDGFGKEVLKSLVDVYASNLGVLKVSTLTEHDMNIRIRVGEALGQVIRRCGAALPSYSKTRCHVISRKLTEFLTVDLLVPPMHRLMRSSHVPTALRVSALSLLATCENTAPLALRQYSNDLWEAMVDLLQTESNGAQESKSDPARSESSQSGRDALNTETLDTQPLSTNSDLAPLRRSALHLLTLMIRSSLSEVYAGATLSKQDILMRRARVTLSYLSATDADGVARVMAREALDLLKDLQKAVLY